MKTLLSFLFLPLSLFAQINTDEIPVIKYKTAYTFSKQPVASTITRLSDPALKAQRKMLEENQKNYNACKPCILQYYTWSDTLLFESYSYLDCIIGWFREYHSNGKVKLSGNYNGSYEAKTKKLICGKRHGQWVYYNQNGDTLYSEFWNDGEFVKQVPEQQKVEIWKTTILLNGEKLPAKIKPGQLPGITIIPHFKNANRSTGSIQVNFNANSMHVNVDTVIALRMINHFDLVQWMRNKGITREKYIWASADVLHNDQYFGHIEFNIDENLFPKPAKPEEEPTRIHKPVYLVHSIDTLQRLRLYNTFPCSVNYTRFAFPDSSYKYQHITIEGYVSNIADTTLNVEMLSESWSFSKNGVPSTVYTDYTWHKDKNTKGIGMHALVSISRTHRGLYYINQAASFISLAGFTTAFFVAPLASINYKGGDFYRRRYLTLAGYGLLSLAVSFPFAIYPNHKFYNLTTKKGKKGNGLWYLE